MKLQQKMKKLKLTHQMLEAAFFTSFYYISSCKIKFKFKKERDNIKYNKAPLFTMAVETSVGLNIF